MGSWVERLCHGEEGTGWETLTCTGNEKCLRCALHSQSWLIRAVISYFIYLGRDCFHKVHLWLLERSRHRVDWLCKRVINMPFRSPCSTSSPLPPPCKSWAFTSPLCHSTALTERRGTIVESIALSAKLVLLPKRTKTLTITAHKEKSYLPLASLMPGGDPRKQW